MRGEPQLEGQLEHPQRIPRERSAIAAAAAGMCALLCTHLFTPVAAVGALGLMAHGAASAETYVQTDRLNQPRQFEQLRRAQGGPTVNPENRSPSIGPTATRLAVSETSASASASVCIGRFSLRLPAGWAIVGREQMIYRSRVTDDFRAFAGSSGGGGNRDRILRGALPPSDPLLREFDIDGVGHGGWFGLGGAGGSAGSPISSRRVVLLAGTAQSGVRLEVLASAGKEAQAQEGLRQLAAGYSRGSRSGFCLVNGAFLVDPGRNESASIVAENPSLPGASLRFSTLAVSSRRTDGPMGDLTSDVRAMAGTGTTLTPQGQAARTVAGFPGRESRALLQEPSKPATMVYRYFFAGEALNAAAPEIIVSLEGPAGQRDTLDGHWDRFLDAVQTVPLR